MDSTIRNFLKKVLISFIMLFISHAAVSAQEVIPDTLKVDLDEIRIEAAYSAITIGKAPFSLSYYVRNSSEITAAPAATLDELAYTLPGIFISNRENYALGERLTIRGLGWRSQFGVRGVQVILDDIPLTVADGQTIMSMIDPAMIRRIELLRGPASTFWGNSSGGVLHLSTKPDPDAPSIQYRGYGGSYSTLKQEIRWNTEIGANRIYGYGSYFDTAGFRDHSDARLLRTGLGMERQTGNKGRLYGMFNYASMPRAYHPGSLTAEQAQETPRLARDLFEDNRAGKIFDQAMAALSYTHDFDSGLLNITAHGTYRDLENPLPFGTINLERYAGGLRTTHQFQKLPFELSTGAEIKLQHDDRLETTPSGDTDVMQVETVVNQALFARFGFPISGRFTVNAGLRADRLRFEADDEVSDDRDGNRDFFALNPAFGFSYQMNQSRIFANFSTSFESPTTTELVNRPGGGNGFNQKLNPERTVSIETGINGNTGSVLHYDVTAFAMRVHDLLISFQETDGGPNFFRNEGRSFHYGIESSAELDIHENWNLRLMGNYLHAAFNGGEYDGNQVPGVAPFRFGSDLEFTLGNLTGALQSEWLDSYYSDSENSEKNPSYILLHTRWNMVISLGSGQNIKPFVAVHNLLNARYNTSVAINAAGSRFYEPGSDRNLKAGIQIDLP